MSVNSGSLCKMILLQHNCSGVFQLCDAVILKHRISSGGGIRKFCGKKEQVQK